MDSHELIARIKQHPDYSRVGMILCHNGVVRGSSRDGRKVTGLEVEVDRERLEAILAKYRGREGIVEILVEIVTGKVLAVGDDIMWLVVAGDVRENVIATLGAALDEIKTTVTRKREYFDDPHVS